jgi:hypothetical protein
MPNRGWNRMLTDNRSIPLSSLRGQRAMKLSCKNDTPAQRINNSNSTVQAIVTKNSETQTIDWTSGRKRWGVVKADRTLIGWIVDLKLAEAEGDVSGKLSN